MKRLRTSKHIKLYTHVIAGKIKGMKIEFTPGEVRPMTSLVKKALFDIIHDCTDLSMLDLFCGSGSISIEAYSRGIEKSDLVESDWNKKKIIEENLEKAGFKNANLIISDVLLYCKNCINKYDFIMVDPPFNWERKEELLEIISESKLLTENGFLVIHLNKKEDLNERIKELICYDIRRYGINKLLFYKTG